LCRASPTRQREAAWLTDRCSCALPSRRLGSAGAFGGTTNGTPNTWIRPASTDVTGERGIDGCVAGARGSREERCGRHDLAGLAVTALRHAFLNPDALERVGAICGKSFDRRDRPPGDCTDRCRTRANGYSAEVFTSSRSRAIQAYDLYSGGDCGDYAAKLRCARRLAWEERRRARAAGT
jgi:hypothetical protein